MVGLYIVLCQFNTTKRYKMIVQINSYQYSNISKLRIFTVCMSYGVHIDGSTCCRFNCTTIIHVLCACELLRQLRHLTVHGLFNTGLLPRF